MNDELSLSFYLFLHQNNLSIIKLEMCAEEKWAAKSLTDTAPRTISLLSSVKIIKTD